LRLLAHLDCGQHVLAVGSDDGDTIVGRVDDP
jgi:hypothetical protein